MDRHPLSPSHKAHDLLPRKRLAALGKVDQKIGVARNLERMPVHRRRRRAWKRYLLGRGVFGLVATQRIRHNTSRKLAKPDRRQQIVLLGKPVGGEHPLHLLAPTHAAQGGPDLPQLPIQQLSSDLDRSALFLVLEPGADFRPGAVGGHNPEPIVMRLLLWRGGDLDDVAVLDLALQRNPPTVDPATDAGLTHLAVNPIGEVENGRTPRE